jgi:hypothetical protein
VAWPSDQHEQTFVGTKLGTFISLQVFYEKQAGEGTIIYVIEEGIEVVAVNLIQQICPMPLLEYRLCTLMKL